MRNGLGARALTVSKLFIGGIEWDDDPQGLPWVEIADRIEIRCSECALRLRFFDFRALARARGSVRDALQTGKEAFGLTGDNETVLFVGTLQGMGLAHLKRHPTHVLTTVVGAPGGLVEPQ